MHEFPSMLWTLVLGMIFEECSTSRELQLEPVIFGWCVSNSYSDIEDVLPSYFPPCQSNFYFI